MTGPEHECSAVLLPPVNKGEDRRGHQCVTIAVMTIDSEARSASLGRPTALLG